MNPSLYGDSFFEFFIALNAKKQNLTITNQEEETVIWIVYQYSMCSLFVLAGCIILLPLLQKRNYKSKHRKQILLVDALLLLLCISRAVALLFSCSNNPVGTGFVIFLWAAGSTLLIVSLALFLFILWSTTKLRSIAWKFKNSLALASLLCSHLLTVSLKEVSMFVIESENIRDWTINFLLVLSLVSGFLYFGLGFYCCGTYRQMNQNREPSIRLVRESMSSEMSQMKVVHTDVKNFRNMVQKLRIVALVAFLKFAITFYVNAKLLWIYNSSGDHELYNWEFWGLEIAMRILELVMVMLIFCVGFFSPQHKEAARQWIRGFSISRSHDDLSTRRTMSFDSNRETISDTRSRTGTLTVDTGYSDNSNETVSLSVDTVSFSVPKMGDYFHPNLTTGSSSKQDARYLMVPTGLVIEMVKLKEHVKGGKKRILLEAVDENI